MHRRNKENAFEQKELLHLHYFTEELRKRVKRLVREISAARRKTYRDDYAIKLSTVGAKHANSFAGDITKP